MNIKIKMVVAATLTVLTTSSFAQKICVFDPLGSSGDNYSLIKDYALVAKQWGADFTLKPYSDERLAAADFKAGKCDAASMTGIRARNFNQFVGSIDSAGGVLGNEATKTVITLMSNPKLAPDMLESDVEVAGISTLGSAFVIVNDRSINSLLKLAGRRFGVLNYDKAIGVIVQKVGGEPVPVELKEIGPMFNSGKIDVIFVPLVAFKPLELSKGMGTKGAIARFPVAATTYDVLIHPNKFPDGYGQNSRTWFARQLDRQLANVNKIEKGIDSNYWMDIAPNVVPGYFKIIREARISLTKDGVYNKKMMGILKKVRCRQDPKNYECPLTDE
ncbi:MAG: putative multidrug efflux protein AdeT1 [Aquirhabdus sp.]